MAPRLIGLPASPVEHSPIARGFVLAATVLAAIAMMAWGHDLLLPPVAVAATCVGHWYSFRSRGRRRRGVQALVGVLLLACFGEFLADLVSGAFGGQLPQAHLTLLLVAVTSFVLRSRRDLYSSLWMSLAIVYLAA